MVNITCTAFEGSRRIGTGEMGKVAVEVKKVLERGERGTVLIFDDRTGEQVEMNWRATPVAALALVDEPAVDEPRRVGRPKLGVVPKEVTLLPRHWEWLGLQPGGASVTLRRLVDEARNVSAGKDRVRQAQEAAYRFMSAIAGNEPGFEEAIRALFAGQRQRFEELVLDWPIDVRDHARQLAAAALD